MKCEVIAKPVDEEGKTKAKQPKNYKITCILEAQDISSEEYEELSLKKKAGKTTTEENYKVEKHFWQRFFLDKNSQ
jgi:hypothetical protein